MRSMIPPGNPSLQLKYPDSKHATAAIENNTVPAIPTNVKPNLINIDIHITRFSSVMADCSIHIEALL